MAAKEKNAVSEDFTFDLFTDFSYDEVKDNVFAHSFSFMGKTDDSVSTTANGEEPETPASSQVTKIEDFGEKIGGARKDMYAIYRDMLFHAAELEVGSVPFSKAWPKPNYEKLIESGMDSWRVDAIRAMRDVVSHIPTRRSYKYTRQHVCAFLRELAIRIVNGDFSDFDDFYNSVNLSSSTDSYYLDSTFRREIKELASIYRELGHSNEIPEFDCGHYSFLRPSYNAEPVHDVYAYRVKTGKYSTKIASYAPSSEEAFSLFIDYLTKELGKGEIETTSKRRHRDPLHFYHVYQMNSIDGKHYIIRKVGSNLIPVKGPFEDAQTAFDFMHEFPTELDNTFAAMKNLPNERGEINQDRSADIYYRDGDISPETFSEVFGFRGVEFGNYVEGPRRQQDLNEAYDALMDLSFITGLPPRALSLGGKLGLAFGARGRGGKNPASAHYESLRTVINLTKKRGAGSLGHEWFHALDNLLAREHEKGITVFLSESSNAISNIELRQAMRELVHSISTQTGLVDRSNKLDKFKTKPYWGTRREYMARSFESYLKAKLDEVGIKNDYLVNVLDEDTWKKRTNAPYAYPTAKETEVIEPFYDNLFENIKLRAEGDEVILYSASDDIDAKSLEKQLIPYDTLTPQEMGLLAFGEQILDIQTAFYDGDPKLHGHFDTSTSTIYLNRSSECDLPWVFAHEAFHAMKQADPALYKDIMELAGGVDSFSKEKIDAYRADRNTPNMPDDIVRQEMLADAFADYTTGRRAFLEMAEKQPNTVRRTLNFLSRAMNDLKNMFFGEKRSATIDKYPNVSLSRDQFHDLSRGLDYLQEELRQSQHLTKGQDMLLSMLADSPKFNGTIHSPFTFQPETQFRFDCKAVEAISELYPDIAKENIAAAVTSFSPCGGMRYEDRLIASSRSHGFVR